MNNPLLLIVPFKLFGIRERIAVTCGGFDDPPSMVEAYACGYLPPRYPMPAIRHDVVLWDNNANGTLLGKFNSCCLDGYPRYMTIMAERMGYWDHVFDTRDALRYRETKPK